MKKKCSKCNTDNVEKAKFCSNCGNQLNCLNCGEDLLVNANNCISCGTPTNNSKSKITGDTLNTIDFRQTKDERTIKVAFTNDAAKEVRESIVQMSTIRSIKNIDQINTQNITSDEQTENSIEEAMDSEFEDITEVAIQNQDLPHIDDLQTIRCSETEWILIFALYKSNFGKQSFTKEEIRDLYNKHRYTKVRAGNYSANWKSLFGIHKDLIITVKDNQFMLTKNAQNKVKGIIKSGKGSAKISTGGHKKKKGNSDQGNSTNDKPKAKPSKQTPLSIINTLNLNPANSISLKDFASKYVAKSYMEKNLIFLYYLCNVLKEKNIGINHVYTCYKHMREKVPGNLYQSLVDTKINKGWIDTSDLTNIIVPINGENYIEHDMTKA